MIEKSLFFRDADRPYLYHVQKGIILVTEEVIRGPIRWTRFVQGRYHRDLGFLDTTGYRRFPVSLITFDRERQSYQQFHDKDWITNEFNKIIQDKTTTAIHYYPGLAISSVVVGLPLQVEEELPERLKATFERSSHWDPSGLGTRTSH